MSQSSSRRRQMSKARYEEDRIKPSYKKDYKMMAENIVLIGYDNEDPLVYYLKSKDENIWNYYKLSTKEGDYRYCWDARRHDPNHAFDGGTNPVDLIKEILLSCDHRMITSNLFYQQPSELVREQDKLFGEVPEVKDIKQDENPEDTITVKSMEEKQAVKNTEKIVKKSMKNKVMKIKVEKKPTANDSKEAVNLKK